jgi:hypothetical protein
LILVSAAALILSLFFTLSSAPSTVLAGGSAELNESFVGFDSSEEPDSEECNPEDPEFPEPGQVLWHFILNGLNPGITSAIQGSFDFTPDSEDQNVASSKWNPGGDTHHFYVYTDGDAVLDGATADIGGSEYNNFVLSHMCHGDEVEESEPQESEPEESESPEGSVGGGTGTPAGSVPDTSTSMPGVGGPLATLLFGAILVASLGALAYANVAAARRRG